MNIDERTEILGIIYLFILEYVDSSIFEGVFRGKWERVNILRSWLCVCVCVYKSLHLGYNLNPDEIYNFRFSNLKKIN